MAKKTLTLQEAYKLLDVTKEANIDEVKQAYRKRAFALHPDLHPDNANAAAEFQRVNEAYVTVIAYLDNEAKKQSAKAQFVNAEKERKRKFEEQKRQAEQKRAEERKRKEKERAERIERERREMERRQAKERAKREEERRRRIQEEIDKEEARIKAKQEEERLKLIKKLEEKAQEFKTLIIEQMEAVRRENEQNAQKQAEQPNQQWAQSQNQQNQFGQANQQSAQEQPQFKKVNNTYNASGEAAYNKYAGSYEQSVYHTSVNDFANTSAFETGRTSQAASEETANKHTAHTQSAQDTAFTHYSTVQNDAQNTQKKNQKEYFTGQEISATKENSIPQAIIKAGTEPLEGIKKGISSWFKSQIDEELELFFPAAKLQPGVKMRLQFRVGLANELQTIELTLPKDFVPGKPMRLKGLGKKIGKWQGDLYLKLQSK